jgi:hypothetical protein
MLSRTNKKSQKQEKDGKWQNHRYVGALFKVGHGHKEAPNKEETYAVDDSPPSQSHPYLAGIGLKYVKTYLWGGSAGEHPRWSRVQLFKH